nr:phage tail tape measure protein [Novosphingopyxis sp. YJ-S2-01]
MDAARDRGSRLTGAGAATLGAGVAVAAPTFAASKTAMDFQGQMVDVKKVLNDVSPAGLKAIEDGLIEIGARVPVPIEGLGQIAAEGARAGVAAKDLLPFVDNSAKMAAAFDITADKAGSMMATWRKGLGLTLPQTVELGDKVNALTNTFGGAAPEIAAMVTEVGPLGKIMGVASGEVASMAQLMNAIGVESSVGSTGIKNFMLTMAAGESVTKTQGAAFQALGLDASNMAQRMQTDARGAILEVLDAIAKLPKDRQSGMLTNLFGRESVAAIAPLLANLEDLKANFALVGDAQNYAGSMGQEFETAMSKTSNKLETATNGVIAMGISFGKQLLPVIDRGAALISTVAGNIAAWARENPALAKTIAVAAAILGGLLVGVGALAIVIGTVMGPLAMARLALFGLKEGGIAAGGGLAMVKKGFIGVGKAIFTAGRFLLMNPIGLAITAIAIGAFLIIKYWDKVAPFFAALWSGVEAVFSGAFTVLKALLMTFTPLGFVVKHWQGISAFFAGIWDSVVAVLSSALDIAKTLFVNFTPLGLIFRHWDVVKPYFAALWEGVKDLFVGVWDFIQGAADGRYNPANILYEKWSRITGFFAGLWNGVKGVFSAGWAAIVALATSWPARMLTIGGQIIAGLVRGIRAAPGAVWNALKDVVLGGVNGVKKLLGIRSPSRVFAAIGGHVTDGLTLGIRRGTGDVLGEMGGLANRLTAAAAFGSLSFAPLSAASVPRLGSVEIAREPAPSALPQFEMPARKPSAFRPAIRHADPAPPAFGRPPRERRDPQPSASYHFTINGSDPQEIARRVRQIIEQIERERAADRRSEYEDD